MKIAVISPSSQSLQDIGAALERGNPSRFIARHEGGLSKLRTIAEQDHPDVIIVEGLCHDAQRTRSDRVRHDQLPADDHYHALHATDLGVSH